MEGHAAVTWGQELNPQERQFEHKAVSQPERIKMAACEFLRVLRAFAFKKNFYREGAKSAKKCRGDCSYLGVVAVSNVPKPGEMHNTDIPANPAAPAHTTADNPPSSQTPGNGHRPG